VVGRNLIKIISIAAKNIEVMMAFVKLSQHNAQVSISQ